MRKLPSGIVTFLFTDVEGSTRLLQELGAEAYAEVLQEHRRVLRDAFARQGGVEVDTQGDAFFVAFPTAAGAVAAAREAQVALGAEPIRIRVGLHTGSPHLTEEGYVGEDVHLGARLAASGHGGQILLSRQTRALVDVELTDLGEHRLKDFDAAVAIYQLGSDPFPPLRTISNTNLPHPASSFLGRVREAREVAGLVREGARLVTLTGPGGIGKTRLALEVAGEVVPDFRAGVFWVPLATLRDPALVSETIAQTLGAKDGVDSSIGEREMLLFLDNFEQVVDAAPELSALLHACPNLRLLVTSRELLRIGGEVAYPVPSLARGEAVELFCTRARLDPSEVISELCRRLDDLPLAVELAAARASVLSPAQILERLGRRLDLLKGGRDADPRQRTLRETIEWSHDLLSNDEKQLFARLSVFAGGCTLEAADVVAEADLDTLQSLVEKSLVRRSDDRLRMLETIRQFAAERLVESGEADAVGSHLAEYLITLAVEAAAHVPGPDEIEWLELLSREHDNLRATLDFLERTDPESGLRLAASLWEFWATRGFLSEGRKRLARAIERTEPGSLEWHVAMHGASFLAFLQQDPSAAAALAREHLDASRRRSNSWGELRALGDLANAVEADGRPEEARALFVEFLALAEREGDERARAAALASLGTLAAETGEFEDARALLEQAADVFRRLRQRGNLAASLVSLAGIDLRLGASGASPRVQEALELGLALRDEIVLAASLILAAAIAREDETARAARLLGAADVLIERAGYELEPGEAQVRRETLEHLRSALGPALLADQRAQGRALPSDEAAELAFTSLK